MKTILGITVKEWIRIIIGFIIIVAIALYVVEQGKNNS
jgi:hypothetical protein